MKTAQYKTSGGWLFLLIAPILLTLGLCSIPAHACDSKFIQEPTATEPVFVTEDLWIGFEYRTYTFPDGSVLVAVRQFTDITGTEVMPHPLFYIVTTKEHVSITYIDREGRGNCFDIERY